MRGRLRPPLFAAQPTPTRPEVGPPQFVARPPAATTARTFPSSICSMTSTTECAAGLPPPIASSSASTPPGSTSDAEPPPCFDAARPTFPPVWVGAPSSRTKQCRGFPPDHTSHFPARAAARRARRSHRTALKQNRRARIHLRQRRRRTPLSSAAELRAGHIAPFFFFFFFSAPDSGRSMRTPLTTGARGRGRRRVRPPRRSATGDCLRIISNSVTCQGQDASSRNAHGYVMLGDPVHPLPGSSSASARWRTPPDRSTSQPPRRTASSSRM